MPKIRFPDDLRTVLSSAMKDARFASVRDVGKFIETKRAVDGIITVDISQDAAPTIADYVHQYIRRVWYEGRTTVRHEDGDVVLFVDAFRPKSMVTEEA